MPREQTSAWSDWLPLHMAAGLWTKGADVGSVTDAGGTWAPDALDALTPATAGATPKPSFITGAVRLGFQLPIPDFIIAKQPRRLAPWSGVFGDDMNVTSNGRGRNVALQIELVLVRRFDGDGAPGPDLSAVTFETKFRGYGALDSANDNAETQDTPVASGPTGAAFLDTRLPSSGTGEQNAAVTFAPDGVARLQLLVLLPETLAIGDVVELNWRFAFTEATASNGTAPVQFYGAKYRWINADFTPFAVNTAIQLMGQNRDAGGNLIDQQLEGQSRADTLPYAP